MFFCASSNDALYLYKILQNIFNTYEVKEWIQLPYFKFSKGHNYVKNIVGVMVLVFCKTAMMLYICTMFCKNIFGGFKVTGQTRFSY